MWRASAPFSSTGATAATVAIDCGVLGLVTTPLTATGNVPSPCLQPISIVITYTGTDVNGNGTIAEATTGSLGVHGTLSSRADLTDATNGPGASGDGVSNCADVAASSSIDGVGSAAASTCGTLPVWVAYSQVRGVKVRRCPRSCPGLPRLFAPGVHEQRTIAASNVVMADPVDPTAPGNPFDSTWAPARWTGPAARDERRLGRGAPAVSGRRSLVWVAIAPKPANRDRPRAVDGQRIGVVWARAMRQPSSSRAIT